MSLYEASHGHAAQTTASRDAAGKIVGDFTGSRYARQQEAEKEQIQQQAAQQQATKQTLTYPTATTFYYGQKAEEIQKRASEFKNTSGTITIGTSEETVRRAKAQGLDVSLDRQSGKIVINSQANLEATKAKLEAIHKQTYAEEAEKWKGVTIQKAVQVPQDSLVDKVASKIGVKSQLDSANQYLSGYVPTLEAFQEFRDTNLEKVGLLGVRQKVTEEIRSNKYTAGFQDWAVHGYQGLKETPVSFAAEQGGIIAASVIGGGLIEGVGLGARAVLVKVGLPKVAGAVEPATNIILGAAVVNEATKIKTVEGGVSFGADLLLMGTGYKAGQKLGVKGWDSLRTFRGQKIPAESLIKPEVLSGKEQFPLTQKGANAQDVINSYKDPLSGEYVGYHATTDVFNTRKPIHSDIKRPDDVPGLYVSPVQEGASPHFLRISGEQSSAASVLIEGIKTADFGKIKTGVLGSSEPLSPNVMKVSISNIERLPEPARYNPNEAQKFLLSEEAPKGSAFLTPVLESNIKVGGRAEAEAIIVPETYLKKSSSTSKYFEWNGRKVEIKEYRTVESGNILSEKTGPNNKDLVTADDLLTSYRYEIPERKGLISYIALPSRSFSYVADPLRYPSSIIDPLRYPSSIIDPLRSSSSIIDPLRSSSSTIDPLRSSSSIIDPLRSSSSTINPLRYVPDSNNRYIPDFFRSDTFDYRPPPPTPDSWEYVPPPPTPDPWEYVPPPPTPDPWEYVPPPPTPDPWGYIPPPEPGDYDFNIELDPLKPSKKIRKTKKKMLKNRYGDPLNIKIKLKTF